MSDSTYHNCEKTCTYRYNDRHCEKKCTRQTRKDGSHDSSHRCSDHKNY